MGPFWRLQLRLPKALPAPDHKITPLPAAQYRCSTSTMNFPVRSQKSFTSHPSNQACRRTACHRINHLLCHQPSSMSSAKFKAGTRPALARSSHHLLLVMPMAFPSMRGSANTPCRCSLCWFTSPPACASTSPRGCWTSSTMPFFSLHLILIPRTILDWTTLWWGRILPTSTLPVASSIQLAIAGEVHPCAAAQPSS